MSTITDTQALDIIHSIMDGTEWSADTLDAIADVVLATERDALHDPHDPRCDTCNRFADQLNGQEWCGVCGSCREHCEDYAGCTPYSAAECKHCERQILDSPDGWIDPEAYGDDSIWRESCQGNTDDPWAPHEPVDTSTAGWAPQTRKGA
jgi:hypothetical protein